MADVRAQGNEIILIVIYLENDQFNKARVSQLIAEGGQSVPTEKIIFRIPRTLDNICRATPLANETYLFDKSSLEEPFKTLASIKKNQINFKIKPLPEWASESSAGYLNK
jgi:predicted ABC-type ATPase